MDNDKIIIYQTEDDQTQIDVLMEPFTAKCKVQGMRDDNSSLSLGQNGRYYFTFSLPEELIDELPEELLRQAAAIAKKVVEELL